MAAVLAGCGSSSNDKSGLTSGQSQALVAQLEQARASAAAHNVAATEAAIDKFRASVARLRREGALSDATARSLRTGAARVLQRVHSDNAPAPQAQPTTPAPAPLPPGQAKKKDKKGKHGKGGGDGEGGD